MRTLPGLIRRQHGRFLVEQVSKGKGVFFAVDFLKRDTDDGIGDLALEQSLADFLPAPSLDPEFAPDEGSGEPLFVQKSIGNQFGENGFEGVAIDAQLDQFAADILVAAVLIGAKTLQFEERFFGR